MNGEGPLIRMRGIARRFGSVHAMCGADFACGAGETHALLGENGAGNWVADSSRNHATVGAQMLGRTA